MFVTSKCTKKHVNKVSEWRSRAEKKEETAWLKPDVRFWRRPWKWLPSFRERYLKRFSESWQLDKQGKRNLLSTRDREKHSAANQREDREGFGRPTTRNNNPTWLPHGLAASDCWVFVAEINDIHNDVLSLWIKASHYKDPPLSWQRAETRHSKVKGNEEVHLGERNAAHMIKRPCGSTKSVVPTN